MARPIAFLPVLALAASLVAGPALAQSVQVLGEHNAWSAYETVGGEGKICFVLSRPTSTEPSGGSEGYFYITHRPAQSIRSEINFVAGFDFAPGSTASLNVGGQSFELFTQDDAAWLADPSEAGAAVQAIRAGSTMSVSGTNAGGQTVRQNFSLSGATAAGRAMDGAC